MVNKLSDTFDITIFTIYGKGELEKTLNQNINVKRMFESTYKELTNLQKLMIPLILLITLVNKLFLLMMLLRKIHHKIMENS